MSDQAEDMEDVDGKGSMAFTRTISFALLCLLRKYGEIRIPRKEWDKMVSEQRQYKSTLIVYHVDGSDLVFRASRG